MSAAASKHKALACASILTVAILAIVGTAGGAGGRSSRDNQPPSAPTNVRVTAATTSMVAVAWDNARDNVGVTAYEAYGEIRRTRVKAPSLTVTKLPCGESFAIWITASDRAGNRSPATQVTVSTQACLDTAPPTTPSNLRQSAASDSAVVLVWDPSRDDTGVVGYGVYRHGALLTVAKEPSATVSGLSCGAVHGFEVDAVDAAGNHSPRGQVWAQTADCAGPTPPGDTTPPTQPTSLAIAAATQTSVSLTWAASTDTVGVTGYGVYRGSTRVTTVSTPSAIVSGLACGTSDTFAVDAYDAAGNRSGKVSVAGTTAACSSPPPPGDTTPPTQPTSLAIAAATQTSVSLTWAASTDTSGVTGYGVYRGSTLVTSVSTPGATVSGLTCGTGYTFAVDAYDAAGNRSGKPSVTGTTAACSSPPPPGDTTPPTQPTSLAIAAATQTSVSLTWAASTDTSGVTGYGVYRGSTLVTSVSTPGATVSGLTCGTGYTFAVDAYDAAGNRSGKPSVTGTTRPCADTQAPTSPSNVQATTRTATSIALSWSASSDAVGVLGYGLYRAGTLIGTASTTTGIFSGLTCNTNYTLAVDAYDAAGNRSTRATVMVATTGCPDTSPPSAPTGLAVSGVSQTGVTLTWNSSSDNVGVTGYDVSAQGAKVGTTTQTTHTYGSLTCGTSYSLGVVAFDAAGNRSGTATVTASTSACSTPPPGGVQYPASYFTGPLGASNPVPTKRGAFLITWLGMPGGATTWTQVRDRVLQREHDMGRRYDGIMTTDWQADWGENRLQWIQDHGSIPIVAGLHFDNTIAQINAGAADSLIDAYANRWRSYNFTIMVRLFHEFDYSHLKYTSVGQEAAFVTAWKRIVDRFRARGATNVGFWWCPSEGGNRSSADAAYPGDAYVDWVGTDSYNWVFVGEDKYATPWKPGWAEFGEIFNYQSGGGSAPRHDTYGPRKPFVVGETGTVWDNNFPQKKGDWFRNIPAAAKNMEYLTGISFFDIDATPWEDSRNNWIVDHATSVPQVYDGFKTMARDPWFNTRS